MSKYPAMHLLGGDSAADLDRLIAEALQVKSERNALITALEAITQTSTDGRARVIARAALLKVKVT